MSKWVGKWDDRTYILMVFNILSEGEKSGVIGDVHRTRAGRFRDG